MAGERAYDKPIEQDQDADTAVRPIGVGPDYVYEDYDPFGFVERRVKPRYYTGDEYGLAGGLSREDRADIQLRLRDVGLIGPKTRIELATWDDTSAGAFRQVLKWANASGRTWREALEDMEMNARTFGSLGGADEERLPPNPLDLQAAARTAGTQGLGRGLTAEETSSFGAGLSSQMMGDNPPGSAGQQEWAREKVRSFDPTRFDARSAVKVASVIEQMLAGQMPEQGLPGEGG